MEFNLFHLESSYIKKNKMTGICNKEQVLSTERSPYFRSLDALRKNILHVMIAQVPMICKTYSALTSKFFRG